MVAAAWKTAITKPAGMTIYNCCTGEVKPITWGRLVSLAIENMRIHPLGTVRQIIKGFNFTHYAVTSFQRERFGIRQES